MAILGKEIMSNVPNLFILGAPKSGTTAFANNISQHKDIFISKKKEPRFFDAHVFYDYEEDYPIKSLEIYLDLFVSKSSQESKYRLDASVFNMYSKKSISNILSLSPDAKFIILLREPLSASISMHKQRLAYVDVKMREISDDFMACWRELDNRKNNKGYPKGCRNKILFRYDLLYSYELYLPFIMGKIKEENLFIGFYEDFINTPELLYAEIFDFLGVENITVNNETLNNPRVIKKSKLLEYVVFLSEKTFNIRQRLGLTGGLIKKIKQYVFSLYEVNVFSEKKSDKTVRDFFLNTNQFLDEIKKE